MSGAVRMIASHGAPARSLSRIAPTAPNVPRTFAPVARRKVLLDRPDDALRGAAGQELQRDALALRRRHWSAFAPEIFTMRSHLTTSALR